MIAPFKEPGAGIDSANGSLASQVFAGRYRIVRALKKGPDSETLLAEDVARGTAVVIKTATAATLSATARMRLEHEAHVLSHLSSAPFPPLLESGFAGELVYLLMPFSPGITLQER